MIIEINGNKIEIDEDKKYLSIGNTAGNIDEPTYHSYYTNPGKSLEWKMEYFGLGAFVIEIKQELRMIEELLEKGSFNENENRIKLIDLDKPHYENTRDVYTRILEAFE